MHKEIIVPPYKTTNSSTIQSQTNNIGTTIKNWKQFYKSVHLIKLGLRSIRACSLWYMQPWHPLCVNLKHLYRIHLKETSHINTVFINSHSSITGVANLLDSIKDLATSTNDSTHYYISPLAMFFECKGVFWATFSFFSSFLLQFIYRVCWVWNFGVVKGLHKLHMTSMINIKRLLLGWTPASIGSSLVGTHAFPLVALCR